MPKIHIPHISFEVTSDCNLRCKFCYNIWKADETGGHERFNDYRQARKTLKRLFRVADVGQIVFTGGEPMLAERFSELVLYARLKKKTVSIITNGTAARPEHYKQLHAIGVGLFQLPVHSADPKVHDAMTQVEGSHRKALESIRILKATGANTVAVIVITRMNYDGLYDTLQFISQEEIKRVMLNRFNVGGAGIRYRDELEMSRAQLNVAYKQASKAGRDFQLRLTSNVCTPLCVVNPNDFINIGFSACSPDVAKRPLTLDIRGDLRFCNHSPVVLGNIFKDKLSDMFQSEAAQLWNTAVPDMCSECNLYARCMAGCRAASQQLGLGLNEVDPIVRLSE